jgi:hypothetical protein
LEHVHKAGSQSGRLGAVIVIPGLVKEEVAAGGEGDDQEAGFGGEHCRLGT